MESAPRSLLRTGAGGQLPASEISRRAGALAFHRLCLFVLIASLAFASSAVRPAEFTAGSWIVPMDTVYQDLGMLQAFGLVQALLRAGIPVYWTIQPGKPANGIDFTASAVDRPSGATVTAHGYRGGPFVVAPGQVAAATAIVDAWQAAYPETKVHVATAAFEAPVARLLVRPPGIAVLADGSEAIAFGYLNAAGIPDSTGSLWSLSSPDRLSPSQVAGPTTTDHRDGALFDPQGEPRYCAFLSMHWSVASAAAMPEVVAETRELLGAGGDLMAACESVLAFENQTVGRLLTTAGFLSQPRPATVEVLWPDRPSAQLDGTFGTVGGSHPAYSLPGGSFFKANGVALLVPAGTSEGSQDVWLAGYVDGVCAPDAASCGTSGRVTFLGGHQYTVQTPISANPTTQGARLLLDALFAAPCGIRPIGLAVWSDGFEGGSGCAWSSSLGGALCSP